MRNKDKIRELDLAISLRKDGDYLGACQIFQKLQKKDNAIQDNATLRFLEATCWTDLGEPETAQRLTELIDREDLSVQNQVDYDYERVRIKRALGHTDKALALVQQAIELTSKLGGAADIKVAASNLNVIRVILLAESGSCEQAGNALRAIAKEEQGWEEAVLSVGDCVYKKKRYEQAIICYEEITKGSTCGVSIYRDAAKRNRGFALYELGKYREAIKELEAVAVDYMALPDMHKEILMVLDRAYQRMREQN